MENKMSAKHCSLYNQKIVDLSAQIQQMLKPVGSKPNSCIPLFFRADDIGIPSNNFDIMIDLFLKHEVPLCLATVPSWLSVKRLEALQKKTGKNNSLFYWHQHGWLHKNYEQRGKKHEFGPSREKSIVKDNLLNGKLRLQTVLQEEFNAFFTPPWNRCTQETLECLTELDFKGLSRSKGAKPESPANLPDIQINIDLHTRKEPEPETALEKLEQEFHQAIDSDRLGIMLHHQRMNKHAFQLLETLLLHIKQCKQFQLTTFKDFEYLPQTVSL